MTEQITYKLDIFEGPLDLLLSLIEKNKIDICDIEISLLLDQYMEYMEKAQEQNLELTADFLEMASTLLYIKSRSLLPKPEEEEEDPKQMLEMRLIEYAKCKKNAAALAEMNGWGKVFFRETEPDDLPKPPQELYCSPVKLLNAYLAALKRLDNKKPLSAKNFSKLIGTRFISVGSKIISLLRVFAVKTKTSLSALFCGMTDRSEIVATFLALLELIRSGRVTTADTENDTEISLVSGERRVKKNTTK